MNYKKCPRCGKLNESIKDCYFCGIIFEKYSEIRNTRLNDISIKLQELAFTDAKHLCEKLFTSYPEHREIDNALLDKINKEETIFNDFLSAKKYIKDNNYLIAKNILENVKSTIDKLQKNIDLLYEESIHHIKEQNKIDESKRYLQLANNALDNGHINSAVDCLNKVTHYSLTGSVEEIKGKIQTFKDKLLKEALSAFRQKNFEVSEKTFNILKQKFPRDSNDYESYLFFLNERNKLKSNILESATNAKNEGRLFESKILFFFLGMQFPELLSDIQPMIQAIGPSVAVCLIDLNANGTIDAAALGVDLNGDRLIDFVSGVVDTNGDGLADAASTIVDTNSDGLADVSSTLVDTNGDGLADVSSTSIDFISSIFG